MGKKHEEEKVEKQEPEASGAQHIIGLRAENVKRLTAVDVKVDPKSPSGLVVVTGKNANGKSSVLDAISAALGGKKAVVDDPIRKGKDKAYVVVETETLVIKRHFTEKDTYLKVTAKNGDKVANPQKILDEMVTAFAIDPMAFAKMPPKDRSKLMLDTFPVELDLEANAAEIKEAEEERAAAGRERKKLLARIEEIEKPADDTPDAEISVAELAQEMGKFERLKSERATATNNVTITEKAIEGLKAKIEDLKEQLASAEEDLVGAQGNLETRKKHAESIEDPQPKIDELKSKIAGAEAVNVKVRAKKRFGEILTEGKKSAAELKKWEEKVQQLRDQRAKALAAAKFPVDGLAVDEAGGVAFKGVPIEQCATSEKIRIGLALASANDKMKVILIREGNDLDDDAMAAVLDFAKQNDIQIWIERIHAPAEGEGQTAVVISNGSNIGAEDADGDHTKDGKDDGEEEKPKKKAKQESMF